MARPEAGGWRVHLERVGALDQLLSRLRAMAGGTPAALGIDAPIGLPLAFGRGEDFPSFLRGLDPGDRFFTVCTELDEIGRAQPFYPRLPRAGMRRGELLERLGLSGTQMLRRCEERSGEQPAAAPMFWTLGANQVGKGALALWREVLLPALGGDDPPALWPFDGALAELLQAGRIVVAETYPANAMRQMQLGLRGSKRRQSDRAAVADRFRALLGALRAEPDRELAGQLAEGFGPGADAEDRFDSLIGLIRMLQVIGDPALDQLPPPEIRRREGWILGRPVSIP